MKSKLSKDFYLQEDVVKVAQKLLGKHIYTYVEGQLTGGIIVETEAYRGPDDRGSHAFNGRRTPRNEMMYQSGGVAYMYICYGIHDMLNIVSGTEGTSHATLIRALEPIEGLEVMRERRSLFDQDKRLCQGPGVLTRALGLSKIHNGTDLLGSTIWLTDEGKLYKDSEYVASARIGMNFDGPYKTIPWRFYVKGNVYVSKPHI